jgi:hypothetical protein
MILFSQYDGIAMAKDNKIYVKILLEKEKSSGNMILTAHFDPQAPNYSKDKNGFLWYPTEAEIDFINEAFELIPRYKTTDRHFVNKTQEEQKVTAPPVEKQLEKEDKEVEQEDLEDYRSSDSAKTVEEPVEPETQNESEDHLEPESPPEEYEKQSDTPPEPEETQFEVEEQDTTTQEELDQQEAEQKKQEEKILVEADEKTIDDMVKRKTGEIDDDGLLVEVDKATIIDKVLKQKKKGKWQRK